MFLFSFIIENPTLYALNENETRKFYFLNGHGTIQSTLNFQIGQNNRKRSPISQFGHLIIINKSRNTSSHFICGQNCCKSNFCTLTLASLPRLLFQILIKSGYFFSTKLYILNTLLKFPFVLLKSKRYMYISFVTPRNF